MTQCKPTQLTDATDASDERPYVEWKPRFIACPYAVQYLRSVLEVCR